MDVFSFFQSIGVDTGTHTSGVFYTKCPKCHDERKKRNAKEFLVNLDTGYCECFHCGYSNHILKSGSEEKIDFTPPPPKPQKFIFPEPTFNWKLLDAIIEPPPTNPLTGLFWVTWYYRNIDDKLTGAKKMEYNIQPGSMKRTESHPVHLYTRDSGYYPCLFYERDLVNYPNAKVILVESEKTAALMRKMFRANLEEIIYLATAGSNGLTDEKAKVPKGRNVVIVYDCDKAGRDGSEAAHAKLAAIANSFVADINPQLNDGTDLADLEEISIDYIRSLDGKQTYTQELIDEIRKKNRAGDTWNKRAADEIAQTILINVNQCYQIGRSYYENNKHEFGVDSAPLLKKIEYFLLQRYEFRRNTINHRIFYRDKNVKNSEFVFCNYNDIWRLCQHNLDQFGKKARVNITDISNLLESDFVPDVNPFTEYFHSLPHWDGVDHIKALSGYIQTTDQPFWEIQFRKALVRMIACTYGHIENRIIMVLVQQAQEKGKDSWLRFLCPPQLREYYKEDPMEITKDSEIALCQNFMWNLPELDSMNKKEISEIKSIISRASVKQRRAYGRQEENMTRIVNFWGTTNKEEFLTDTQNTRWLCFRVETINHRYNDYINNIHEIDIDKVWAQAWHLYKSGESFNLSEDERRKRDVINHTHEYMSPEKQLIIKFLTPCTADMPGAEFVTNVEILEYLIAQTGGKLRLAPENVGRSMSQLDFVSHTKRMHNKPVRGYYAIRQPLLKSAPGYGSYNSTPEPPRDMFSSTPYQDDTSDLPF